MPTLTTDKDCTGSADSTGRPIRTAATRKLGCVDMVKDLAVDKRLEASLDGHLERAVAFDDACRSEDIEALHAE
jgi:hypothetical protein